MITKILSRDNMYPPIELYNTILRQDIYNYWKDYIQEWINNKIWLYIHIPFCKTKCDFCHCNSFASNVREIKTYINNLENEVSFFSPIFTNRKISNIYFWGGTPSILENEELDNFLNFVYSKFNFVDNVPFCFEAMPETLTESKIDILQKYWVSRLSLWIQTLDENVLKNINRIQDLENLIKIVKYIKQKIKYLNVDLVCWLEWETIDSFKYWLEIVLDMNPDIIHVYRFNPSETTNFSKVWKMYSNNNKSIREQMYQYAVNRIKETWRKKLKNDDYWFSLDARNISIVDRIENASSNLGIWFSARSNIFWKLSYVNSAVIEKWKSLDSYIGYYYSQNDEKNRYVLQNFIDGISLKKYKDLFSSDFIKDYSKSLKFLIDNYWKDSIIINNDEIKINFEKLTNTILNSVFFWKDILEKLKFNIFT